MSCFYLIYLYFFLFCKSVYKRFSGICWLHILDLLSISFISVLVLFEFIFCYLYLSWSYFSNLLSWICSLLIFIVAVNYCCCSVAKSCLTLCNPRNHSMPVFPVLQYLPELAQTHVHWVSDAFQPFHPCCTLVFLPSIFPSIRIFNCRVHTKYIQHQRSEKQYKHLYIHHLALKREYFHPLCIPFSISFSFQTSKILYLSFYCFCLYF